MVSVIVGVEGGDIVVLCVPDALLGDTEKLLLWVSLVLELQEKEWVLVLVLVLLG